jgi:hypothetical protein
MYENGVLKPVEVISRKEWEINGSDEPNWGKYIYIWKWHNEIPCITITY